MDLTQLTDLMDELARQTWFNLKTARRLSMRMGEVTVTEVNLLAMSRLLDAQGIPAELIPTRADESTTGVDFEIWLDVNGARFFGYSIQAKIVAVRGNKFSYPQLSHHDAHGKFQYELLEDHARSNGSRAVHLFFNGWEDGASGAPGLPAGPPESHYGCAAVMTAHVRRKRVATATSKRSSVTASDYLGQAMPWSDLFRLPRPPGGSSTPGNNSSPSTSWSAPFTPNAAPRRALDLTPADVDELERHIDELAGEETGSPRRPDRLPDYVERARGLQRSQLSRDPGLPLYALVIHP